MKKFSIALLAVVIGLVVFVGFFPSFAGNNSYPIKVNYAYNLEKMLRMGEYDWVNSSLNSTNFSINGYGAEGVTIELIPLEYPIDSDKEIRRLGIFGFRPANLAELLALGAQYPRLQMQFPIVALGSAWKTPSGHMAVPVLWGVGNVRIVNILGRGVLGWHDNIQLAAVRNK